MRPSLQIICPPNNRGRARPQGGRGECRVPAAPAARVQKWKAHGSHHGRTGNHPAFPHAMVLTAYAALSPATNSSCHRHRRMSGFARPGWARNTSADLAPATGARTTRFCRPRSAFARRPRRHVHIRRSIDEDRSNIVRPRARVAHGKPPCDHNCAPDAAASTASRPNVRDDGQRPS